MTQTAAPRAAEPGALSPARVLRACGWLRDEAGLTRVRDLSSSHKVQLATRSDGAQAVVKQRKPDGRRGLAPEMFVYRLAIWNRDLEQVLARPLHIDEAAQVLAIEALPVAMQAPRGLDFDAGVGRALAIIHRATSGRAMPPSQAMGILNVADRPEETGRDRPESTRAFMRRIAAEAPLAEALRRAAGDYRLSCLIHGDLRPEHWICLPDGSLRLIDWEMSGGGDPALDLAQAMVEPALELVRSGHRDFDWLGDCGDRVRTIARAYAAAQGPIALGDPEARRHIVRLGAARLLHVGCEWSDSGQLDQPVDSLFRHARALIARTPQAMELLSA